MSFSILLPFLLFVSALVILPPLLPASFQIGKLLFDCVMLFAELRREQAVGILTIQAIIITATEKLSHTLPPRPRKLL